jgi:hypothetical protein
VIADSVDFEPTLPQLGRSRTTTVAEGSTEAVGDWSRGAAVPTGEFFGVDLMLTEGRLLEDLSTADGRRVSISGRGSILESPQESYQVLASVRDKFRIAVRLRADRGGPIPASENRHSNAVDPNVGTVAVPRAGGCFLDAAANRLYIHMKLQTLRVWGGS